jgi:hypothetical protein
MDSEIRVSTDVKYKEIYNDLKNVNAIEDFHQLFFLCVCLAFKKDKRTSINKIDNRFWSRTITPREWAVYYAIALKTNNLNFEVIEQDKVVIALVEEYANAGMGILIDDFLNNYLIKSSESSSPKLEKSYCSELPKQLISFLINQGI